MRFSSLLVQEEWQHNTSLVGWFSFEAFEFFVLGWCLRKRIIKKCKIISSNGILNLHWYLQQKMRMQKYNTFYLHWEKKMHFKKEGKRKYITSKEKRKRSQEILKVGGKEKNLDQSSFFLSFRVFLSLTHLLRLWSRSVTLFSRTRAHASKPLLLLQSRSNPLWKKRLKKEMIEDGECEKSGAVARSPGMHDFSSSFQEKNATKKKKWSLNLPLKS